MKFSEDIVTDKVYLMEFIARNIIQCSSHKSRPEYALIQEIAAARPKEKGIMTMLQEIDNTNVVAWFMSTGDGYWKLASDFFVVTPARRIRVKGARYDAEKEAFVKKYYGELYNVYENNLSHRHPETEKIIKLARQEVGYSCRTASLDIIRMLELTWRKHTDKLKNSTHG